MKIRRILIIFSLLALMISVPRKAHAQIVEVGVTGGLSYYIGDINPKKHFAQSGLALGGLVRYYDNLRWAFRLQYTNMSLKASDQVIGYKPQRALAFNSKVNDIAFIAEFNFFDYWTGSNRNYVTPYIFAGISVFTFDTYAPDGTFLQPLMTEGVAYGRYGFSIPFGVGMKYSMTSRVGMTLEWRLHKTFTDYIDDVHGLYPEINEVNGNYYYTDPSGLYEPGMQRGNGTSSFLGYNCDWYGTLNLSLLFRFNLPSKEPCYSDFDVLY